MQSDIGAIVSSYLLYVFYLDRINQSRYNYREMTDAQMHKRTQAQREVVFVFSSLS